MEEVEIDTGLFEEPEDFRPPAPQATDLEFVRANGEKVPLRLIGSSPLYGHILTNAARYTANFVDAHPEWVENKTVVEFGSGGALPSLVCGLNGARTVVATDYPDAELIANIAHNIRLNRLTNVRSHGFIWGDDVSELRRLLGEDRADLLLLSDVIFNHTEHVKLLNTCRELLAPNGKCFVIFSPHRPHLFHKDLEFFETAGDSGFKHSFVEETVWSPLFESDTDESTVEIRSKVYAHLLELP